MSAASFSRYMAGGSPTQQNAETLRPAQAMTLQDHARQIVFNYVSPRVPEITEDQVYVVWFTYVIGNWKAMVSTSLKDGMYYEVTHNLTKSETYLDVYKKKENICIPDTAQDFS